MNIELLKNFNKKNKIKVRDISNELINTYHITNICDEDEESLWCISEALYDDIDTERANYEGYIKEGMNARLLMELRKNALFQMNGDFTKFYNLCNNCTDYKEVIKRRRDFMQKNVFNEYYDYKWQYYFLMKYLLRGKSRELNIDFECFFADGNIDLQTNPDVYQQQWAWVHMPDSYKKEHPNKLLQLEEKFLRSL